MKKLIFTGILMLGTLLGHAQGVKDLVINELLVWNIDNYEDDYGHRVSWIELFNDGYSKANVASCYLVLESDGQSFTYRIPKGDSRTSIDPQGYTVFFCEGTDTKGTFHTNFTLDFGEYAKGFPQADSMGNYPCLKDKHITLALLEQNGKDTIDKVTYNLADQRPDISIGLHPDAAGKMALTALGTTTPYATNITEEALPQHEVFRQNDPYGYGMAVTAMSVVLTALLLLYLAFRSVGKLMVNMAHKKKMAAQEMTTPVSKEEKKKGIVSGEEIAAISMALQMFENDLHDNENTVLTINKVAKAYSPWSSKIYGLSQGSL